MNGDLPTYDIASRTDSATGNINAGSYSIDSSNLANLGYSVTGGPSGTLTVNPKVVSLTVAEKVYDASTSLTGLVSITTGVSGGGIIENLNYENAVSNSKNVVTSETKYLSGIDLINGTNGLASNYTVPTLDRDNSAAVTINPKEVKLSASKVFDGTNTLSSVNIFTDGSDGYLSDETLSFSDALSTSIHVENGNNRIKRITLEDGTDGNGGIATNYELPEEFTTSNAPVTITVKTLTPTLTNTGVTKEYDGTVSAPSDFTPTYSFVGLVSGDNDASLSHIDANYDNANVGTGKTLTVTGLTINSIGGDGSRAGNPSFPSDYVLDENFKIVPGGAAITAKNLTITANNHEKFSAQSTDPSGFAGVSYSGFVPGENASDLSGSLSIARSNSGINSAGTYVDVLVPSGYSSSNYNITWEPGDFTIIPSNRLLVQMQESQSEYGSDIQLAVGEITYYDGASSSLVTIPSDDISIDSSNTITINEGGVNTASFDVEPTGTTNSSAGKVKVGTYLIGLNEDVAVVETSSNFDSSVEISGSHTVTQKNLVVTATGGLSKIYDGDPNMEGLVLSLEGIVGSDQVSADGLGTYRDNDGNSDKNVNIDGSGITTNKRYTVENIALGGIGGVDDSANYYLAAGPSISGTNGEITKKQLTHIAISKTYDGYDILHWDGSAVPVGGVSTLSKANTGQVDGLVLQENFSYNYGEATIFSKDVATANNYINSIELENNGDGSGFLARNYNLPTLNSTNTPATVNTKRVNLSATKTYDGDDSLDGSEVTITTGVNPNGTTETLTYSGATSSSARVAGPDGDASVEDNYIDGITLGDASDGSGGLSSNYHTPSLSAINQSEEETINAVNINPATLIPTLTNSGYSQVYDGSNVADLTPSWSFSGLVSGDTDAALTFTGKTYNDPHVVNADTITVAGLAISSITGSNGSQPSDYTLDEDSKTVAATITTKELTPTISNSGYSQVYDGDVEADIVPSWNYNSSLVGGDTSASFTFTSKNYNDKDVSDANKITISGLVIDSISGSNDSLASDYHLDATSKEVAASISQREVYLRVTKQYDATLTIEDNELTALSGSNETTNVVSGESLTFTKPSGSLASNDKNVAGNTWLDTDSITLADGTGGLASNYMLPPNSFSSTKNNVYIHRKTVTITGFDVDDKDYDGTSVATISSSGSLSGVESADVGKVVYIPPANANFTIVNSEGTRVNDNNVEVDSVTGNEIAKDVTLSLNLNDNLGPPDSGTDEHNNYRIYDQTFTDLAIIRQRDITLTTPDRSKDYGDSFTLGETFSLSSGSYATGESVASITLNAANDYHTSPTQNVGVYNDEILISGAVGAGGFSTNNYNITYDHGDLTINKRELSLLATKVYDGTTHVLSGEITLGNRANDETFSLSNATSGATAAGDSKNVTTAEKFLDTSTLTVTGTGGADFSNYKLPDNAYHATKNNLTVTPKPLTIVDNTLQSEDKFYDGNNAANVTGGSTASLQSVVSTADNVDTDGRPVAGDDVAPVFTGIKTITAQFTGGDTAPADGDFTNLIGSVAGTIGSGHQFDVSISGGTPTVSVVKGGEGFATDSVITIAGSNLGGADGVNDLTITIDDSGGSGLGPTAPEISISSL